MRISVVICVVGVVLIRSILAGGGGARLALPAFLAVAVVMVCINLMRRLPRLGAGDVERLARQLTD